MNINKIVAALWLLFVVGSVAATCFMWDTAGPTLTGSWGAVLCLAGVFGVVSITTDAVLALVKK
jgi:hypothetical protein